MTRAGAERSSAEWFDGAVLYGVVPHLFGQPPLEAVTRRLDHLQRLGVDGLWLCPINATPPGNYGYAVTDYFAVREDYGTGADLLRLVEQAHARDLRVVLDFVPNHTSDRHRFFEDAERNGRASPYYDFYDRDEDGRPTHYFDWIDLPNLNYDNPDVRALMLDAFTYWVREFDVDGFRVDVAWGIKQRRPSFWPEWRDSLRRLKPDIFLLAEAGVRDPYYLRNGFDAAYDWTDELGRWAWKDVFDAGRVRLGKLRAALTGAARYPLTRRHPLTLRFINNNDTGARFITAHGPAVTRVATALLLTLPGVPCLFTGDEFGEEFEPYRDSAPLRFRDRYELLDWHLTLLRLRRDLPALRSPSSMYVDAFPGDRVLAYVRHRPPETPAVLVVLNFGEATGAELLLPEGVAPSGTLLRDHVGGDTLHLGRGGKLELPAWSARVLTAVEE